MRNNPLPPDQMQREEALDVRRSLLVRAPAGSGKTDLLTRRFLRLLAEVDEPGQVVAITFTNAAAAEMRQRILAELEQASTREPDPSASDFSMQSLAARALAHAQRRGWRLLQSPQLLRISTIDAFCRDLALQQPLLSGLGGGLEIHELPQELYRRAARRALERLAQTDASSAALRQAIELLLLWRDNNWNEIEDLTVRMLSARDRWMREFVLARDLDEAALRDRLERPFTQAVREHLTHLEACFQAAPHVEQELLALARFAAAQSEGRQHAELAELESLPAGPYASVAALDAARHIYLCVCDFLLTGGNAFRALVNVSNGFPPERKQEKERFKSLIAACKQIDRFEPTLAATRSLPPTAYSQEDWEILRACFTLLRQAAAELHVVFAEAGAVDFIEIAQIAESVLSGQSSSSLEAALAVADGVRHLLVDEFQDTSRKQYQLLARLVAAWPEREGRTCFAVGDPMQSIYFFRDADPELFTRVQTQGLEIGEAETLPFGYLPLESNFRTEGALVTSLNRIFAGVFARDDGSGIHFSPATPARPAAEGGAESFALHLTFEPHGAAQTAEREQAQALQLTEIVALIRERLQHVEEARQRGARVRIAVLGRARRDLIPVARALREAAIPFRAVDLEKLADRPETLDALALVRAALNPLDRVAWLGVLRAPWCGLRLASLHALTSGDNAAHLARPIVQLARERLALLPTEEQAAAQRTLSILADARRQRALHATSALGSWLRALWVRLGGPQCVDATASANLDLFWSALDRLPNGEEDLTGPALPAALANLTALPDPTVDPDYGVQLMTIHKSKGLEFEYVLVPELHSAGGRGGYQMLSWMERGLSAPDDSGELTEFLIAPLQTKGADRGRAKAWVDRAYREREQQEMRRILYVAATRAREELHLFARPSYKSDKEGRLTLATPGESLLATAWPALQEEIGARFAAWRTQQEAEQQPDELLTLAASSAEPAPATSFLSRAVQVATPAAPQPEGDEPPISRLYDRHEGGASSRALGLALHAALEELARLRAQGDWLTARAALPALQPRLIAQIRATGVDPRQAGLCAAEALRHALHASESAVGQWILSPHAEAQSEASWTGLLHGALRTVRVDRLFRAGERPGVSGEDCWWILDYKSALSAELTQAADAEALRPLYAPQLEAYAAMLRLLHGETTPIRAGLFYPRAQMLDWWAL